jgi:hypothetical protein
MTPESYLLYESFAHSETVLLAGNNCSHLRGGGRAPMKRARFKACLLGFGVRSSRISSNSR